jgi:hypothetical protein
MEEGKDRPYIGRAVAHSSFSILNKKEIGVKFDESIIVKGKLMKGDQIFMCGRNMQDIVQGKGTSGGGNNRSSNVSNGHTGSVCIMDLIMATIGVMHCKLVKMSSDVVHSFGVSVPRVVDGRGCRHACGARLNSGVVFVVVPARLGGMAKFGTNLALMLVHGRGTGVADTTSGLVAEASALTAPTATQRETRATVTSEATTTRSCHSR